MSIPQKPVEGGQEPSENMSVEQLIAQRIASSQAPETEEEETNEEAEEVEETETEEISGEETETEEEESEEAESEEEEEQEQPEIDLLSLNAEQIQELAKKGKSRLLQRIGELTAKNHSLEEKLNSAKPDAKPLPAIPAAENPFRDLKTVEEVNAKYSELEKVAEETDRILEDHEDYGPEDLITLGGKEFTKKEVRVANRNAKTAMLKYLPAQHQELVRSQQRTLMEEQFNAAIPKQIPELADENSELSKKFKSMMEDPLVEQVRQQVPDLAPQLGYLLAHAVRSIESMASSKKAAPAPGVKPQPKVAGNPVGVGASRTAAKPAKKQADAAYQEFEKTGSPEAWAAFRALQRSAQ